MNTSSTRRNERGAALYFALVIGVSLMGMSAIMVETSSMTSAENQVSRKQAIRLQIAEAAVRRGLYDLNTGGTGTLGSAQAPVAFGQGAFWTTTTDNGDGTYTIVGRGRYGDDHRAISAVVQDAGGVFHHAVFAGNDSNDPTYQMDFSGNGSQADVVDGDVYSGNDLVVAGDATVTGTARASGSISGMPGESGVTQPIPDIQGMGYESNHGIDVAHEFNQYGYWNYDNAGGYAYQMSSSRASHIFRKNPTDRSIEVNSTVKDDYFLEDPYRAVRVDRNQNGSDPYFATMTSSSNDQVFFIDGNLWIHNKRTYSIKLAASGGARVTFVVKGNVYVSDNLFVNGGNNGGVAFIAMKDSAVADSGNIYFGDPVFGTLRRMNAFMYAEGNFHDNNLDSSGSSNVELNGIMSAGNHVDINRTWSNGQHSQLEVNFDSRIKDGTLNLPGLPTSTAANSGYSIISWHEVAK